MQCFPYSSSIRGREFSQVFSYLSFCSILLVRFYDFGIYALHEMHFFFRRFVQVPLFKCHKNLKYVNHTYIQKGPFEFLLRCGSSIILRRLLESAYDTPMKLMLVKPVISNEIHFKLKFMVFFLQINMFSSFSRFFCIREVFQCTPVHVCSSRYTTCLGFYINR